MDTYRAYKAMALINLGTEGSIRTSVASLPVDWVHTYRIGRWNTPKHQGSKLYCFAWLEAAKDFVHTDWLKMPRLYEIWECEVENPMLVWSIVHIANADHRVGGAALQLQTYWEGGCWQVGKLVPYTAPPLGTITVSRLKPLELAYCTTREATCQQANGEQKKN